MAKQNGGSITKKDVRAIVTEIVSDALERILEGVEGMFEQQNRTFDRRFRKLESGHADLKRQLTDLKVDTPTRSEFDELKGRVDKYHPLAE